MSTKVTGMAASAVSPLTQNAHWNPPVTATHSRLLLSQGHAAAAALTGGFQWAFWVSGLTALAAVPVTFLLIRRRELARAVAAGPGGVRV